MVLPFASKGFPLDTGQRPSGRGRMATAKSGCPDGGSANRG